MLLSWISFLIVGLVAGWLAEQITKSSMGLGMNLLVGVIGALIGRVIFALLGLAPTNIIGAIVAATLGAVVLLLVAQAVRKK
ncbi:MAG: GlsB/YeaQ/YmgE family stress response membrane protein [Rubricoccaceae bacterium]